MSKRLRSKNVVEVSGKESSNAKNDGVEINKAHNKATELHKIDNGATENNASEETRKIQESEWLDEHENMESWHAHDTDQVGVEHSEMKLISRAEPVDKSTMLKGTDADPFEVRGSYHLTDEMEVFEEATRQKSLYNDDDRARADNNQFFKKRSNPLSSKGN